MSAPRITDPRMRLHGAILPPRCHAQKDGDCGWADCPQERDGEPEKSGRHCPLDVRDEDSEL